MPVRRREHDAVREARDALVIVGAATPFAVVAAGLIGAATAEYLFWERWLAGTVVVAALLLGTLASALLLADRAGHRMFDTRPHAVRRHTLIAASLVIGLLLVAGIPTTWPIVLGFAIVCAILGGIILLGASFNM